MFMKRSRLSVLSVGIVFAFIFTCVIGCGDGLPHRVPISGRVLLDGKPLEKGTIKVCPANERSAYGTLGPGGKFTLSTFDDNDGTMMGKHPVAIISKEDINETKSTKWLIPKKYSEIATSGLEIDVPGPRSDVEINVTWGGGKPFIEKY
jgi:hypothetical protein